MTVWMNRILSSTAGGSTNGYRSLWPIDRLIMFSAHASGSHISIIRSKPLGPSGFSLECRAGRREAESRGGVDGVADVQVVGEGLGPVLGGMHRGVGGDVVLLPAGRRALRVVPVQRRLVVDVRIAEQLLEPLRVGRVSTSTIEVVVADLVPEVPEQGAVRLVHRHAQLLAVDVVALGEVEGDHAVRRAR